MKRSMLTKKKRKALVMEPDASLRQLMMSMLDVCGYSARFTESGDEAIDLYKKAIKINEPFDVVLLAMNNPGTRKAKKTFNGFLDADPEVKTVVVSGRMYGSQLVDCEEYGFHAVLAKPFTVKDMNQILQRIRAS